MTEKELLEFLKAEAAADAEVEAAPVYDAVSAIVADNESLRRQVRSLRSALAVASPAIEALWKTAREQVLSVYSMLAPYLDPEAPMGTEWDEKVQAGYETDPEPPKPEHGDRGTCAGCGEEIRYTADSHSGYWMHAVSSTIPGHAAVFGGPA